MHLFVVLILLQIFPKSTAENECKHFLKLILISHRKYSAGSTSQLIARRRAAMRADWLPADMLIQDQNANELQLWLEEQRNASVVGGENLMLHERFCLFTVVRGLFNLSVYDLFCKRRLLIRNIPDPPAQRILSCYFVWDTSMIDSVIYSNYPFSIF
jgi:hypothetical protein